MKMGMQLLQTHEQNLHSQLCYHYMLEFYNFEAL